MQTDIRMIGQKWLREFVNRQSIDLYWSAKRIEIAVKRTFIDAGLFHNDLAHGYDGKPVPGVRCARCRAEAP